MRKTSKEVDTKCCCIYPHFLMANSFKLYAKSLRKNLVNETLTPSSVITKKYSVNLRFNLNNVCLHN